MRYGYSFQRAARNAARATRIWQMVENPYTGEIKKVYGHSSEELSQNIENQFARWHKQKERQISQDEISQLTHKAERLNSDLNRKISALQNIVSNTDYTQIKTEDYYKELLKTDDFPEFVPSNPPSKSRIEIELSVPAENKFIEFFSNKKKQARLALETRATNLYLQRMDEHKQSEQQRYNEHLANHQKHIEEIKKHNAEINARKDAYQSYDVNEILEVAEHYVEQIHRFNCKIEFDNPSKTFTVSLNLPELSDIPVIREYKFIKSKKEIREMQLAVKQHNLFHESVVFQMVLKTAHDLFSIFDFTKKVVIKGFMDNSDPKTGQMESSLVILLDESRESYENINLSNVDLKECLKGLGASFNNKFTPIKIKPTTTRRTQTSQKAEEVTPVDVMEKAPPLISNKREIIDPATNPLEISEDPIVQDKEAPVDDLMAMFFKTDEE